MTSTVTPRAGKKWTKTGAAFPHKEVIGFSIELRAFPIDGRLVVLPPDTDDGNSRNGKQATIHVSSPTQSGRDVRQDGRDHVRIVFDAELIRHGQQ